MPDLNEEKKRLARTLVSLRYSIDNPAFDITMSLDEPVEKISLADFYNGPAATWVRINTPFDWLPIDYAEFNDVFTVRDLGRLCFAHLTGKPPSLDSVVEDIV
jgi:hypothetical protein